VPQSLEDDPETDGQKGRGDVIDCVPEFVIVFALAAKFSDIVVWLRLEAAGEQFTNMRVFAEPPIESCNSWVSL